MRSLVIDDEFIALSKMVSLLEPLGPCDAATNGAQALEMFGRAIKEGCLYDLITVDINMPDMNGISLLARFRAEERMRRCVGSRKIVVSADSSSATIRAALMNECDEFIVKPIKRDVLMGKLAHLQLLPAGGQVGAAETPPNKT